MAGRTRASNGSRLAGAAIAVFALLAVVAPAGAAPPERFEERPVFIFPDFENGAVVFLNTTRADVCVPGAAEFEVEINAWFQEHGEDFFAWLEAGNNPADFDPPMPVGPPRPEGSVPVAIQHVTTSNGAIVELAKAKGVPIELWALDSFGPGPCTDTASQQLMGAGTATVHANDNDLDASGTRGNAFGSWFRAKLVAPGGDSFVYSSRFHVNDRCRVTEFEPPSCLVERGSFR